MTQLHQERLRPSGPRPRDRRLPRLAFLSALTITSLLPAHRAAAQAGREQTADQQAQHALSRLAFGARPGDVERVRTLGVDQWIQQQLYPERIADTAVTSWLTGFPTLTMTGAELVAKYPAPGQLQRMLLAQSRTRRGDTSAASMSPEDSVKYREALRATARATAELATSRVGRAVLSERQLNEVMVDFWTNHFNVFLGKPQTRYYVAEYETRAIRPHAMGSFRELLGAVAKSPAMLTYLDQAQSVADSNRQTLSPARAAAQRPRANATRDVPRAQRAAMENLTVGELLDRNRLPEQLARRVRALPDDQLRRVRMMTLREVQDDPAALLANAPNRSRGINENYARELMELHTLGVDGGYTQQDVMEVARALTGWTMDRGPGQGGSFVFRAEAHDAEAKTILGASFPKGQGQAEGERVLDLLANHPSTARFIATKLVRRFVSDEPPAALVDAAAKTFLSSKGDIRAVLNTILTSDAFFSTSAYRAKVKTPFELVVSASRALGGRPDATPVSAQLIARLGQQIYGRATPDGYPDVASEWINTGSILNRMNFGLVVGSSRLPGARVAAWTTARELSKAPEEAQVDGLIRALFGGDVSPDTRSILMSGENPLLAQAPAGSDSLLRIDDDPEMVSMQTPNNRRDAPRRGGQRNALGSTQELTGFARLVGLAIGAPEFQRR